jgi:predicted DNA-binding transcriptional regulator AlpA
MSDSPTLLNARGVRRYFGNVSHMWIVRRIDGDPQFPKPIYLGRCRYWRVADLDQYVAAKAAEPPPNLPCALQR